MILALLLATASVSPEFELTAGAASPDPGAPSNTGPLAPALGARAGVSFEHLTLSAFLLGVAGGSTGEGFCGGSGGFCRYGQTSFSAMSGFATLRLHTSGNVQGFIEGGAGAGQLKSLSSNDLFENPAQHGRLGPAFFLAAGARWFPTRRVSVGLEAAWTKWTNVSRPEFTYGASPIAAASDLKVSALLVLFSVGFSPGRQ